MEQLGSSQTMAANAVPDFSAAALLCHRAAQSIYVNDFGERPLRDLKAYGFERWVYKVRSNTVGNKSHMLQVF